MPEIFILKRTLYHDDREITNHDAYATLKEAQKSYNIDIAGAYPDKEDGYWDLWLTIRKFTCDPKEHLPNTFPTSWMCHVINNKDDGEIIHRNWHEIPNDHWSHVLNDDQAPLSVNEDV
jgi:hypothetical protein